MPIFWISAADFCRLSREIFLLSTTSAKPSTRSIPLKVKKNSLFFESSKFVKISRNSFFQKNSNNYPLYMVKIFFSVHIFFFR
jgi:hypothetical protein